MADYRAVFYAQAYVDIAVRARLDDVQRGGTRAGAAGVAVRAGRGERDTDGFVGSLRRGERQDAFPA